MIGIDEVVESGLKELEGGRLVLGRFLGLHRESNWQGILRKQRLFGKHCCKL
jgi:hypothetical protein